VCCYHSLADLHELRAATRHKVSHPLIFLNTIVSKRFMHLQLSTCALLSSQPPDYYTHVSTHGHTYLFDVGHFWPQLLGLRLLRKVMSHMLFLRGRHPLVLHIVVYDRWRWDRKLLYGGWGNNHSLHEHGVRRVWVRSVRSSIRRPSHASKDGRGVSRRRSLLTATMNRGKCLRQKRQQYTMGKTE